ncbi:MAG TPA: roadblock/LC7 domain-containing protein [Gaiellaceae bacterium]
MDASQALADLTEISSQVEQVAIVGEDGAVLASTFGDEERAKRFADGARRLVEEAETVREARGLGSVGQLEAATLGGSVFVVRENDRLIAATTKPEPTVGLVFYDLKHCLRSIEDTKPATKSPVRESGPVEGVSGEPGGSPGDAPQAKKKRAATKSPVRASGPVEGVPGEPGGSPAPKARPRKKSDAAS